MTRKLQGLIVALLVLFANIGVITSQNIVYATEESVKFKVINHSTFTDENGFLNVVGFIKNTSEKAGMVPTIKLKLLNKQDVVVYKSKSDPLIQFINPGSMVPFKITVTDTIRSKQTANFKITFDQKLPSQLMNSKPAKLVIENVKIIKGKSGMTRIEGDIRNDGSKATDAFTIAIALMNERNQVFDTRVVRYGVSIATGAKISFNMEYKQPSDKYCLLADSRYYVATPIGICEITGKKIISKSTKDITMPRSSDDATDSQSSGETVRLPQQLEKTITISKFKVLDANKVKLQKVHVGQEIRLRSVVINNLTSTQSFTYIVQIKDQEGMTVMLKWVEGKLFPAKKSRPAVQWIPEEPRKYDVQIFVWKNLEDPSPLTAQPMKTSIEVKDRKA